MIIDLYNLSKSDENRIIKNNMISLITLFYILCLDKSSISNLKFDKIYNYTTFSLYGNIYFSKLKINISKTNKYNDISCYNIFCYLIYYFTNLVIKNNLWEKYKFDKNESTNN
jgi:hypothetical protein